VQKKLEVAQKKLEASREKAGALRRKQNAAQKRMGGRLRKNADDLRILFSGIYATKDLIYAIIEEDF